MHQVQEKSELDVGAEEVLNILDISYFAKLKKHDTQFGNFLNKSLSQFHDYVHKNIKQIPEEMYTRRNNMKKTQVSTKGSVSLLFCTEA